MKNYELRIQDFLYIPSDAIVFMREPEKQHRIRNTALRLLTRKPYTVAELENKLTAKFPEDTALVTQVIKECQRIKLLNDLQYAQEYVRYRLATSPRGKFSLRLELQKKGVPPDIISQVLETLFAEGEEVKNALAVATRKQQSFVTNLPKKKQKEKLFRFLSSRGFSKDVVFQVLEEVL